MLRQITGDDTKVINCPKIGHFYAILKLLLHNSITFPPLQSS
jgi:hypothetical protein